MEAIAKFEKVSFEQFCKDCWNETDHFPTEEEVNSMYNDELLNYNLFLTMCTYVYDNIKLPTRATNGSAGYDFYLPEDTYLSEKYYKLIPTGIRCNIKPGYVLMLYPRSSLGFKHAFALANTTGIIDSDYYNSKNEGHILVKASAIDLNLEAGDRFIQGIFLPYYLAEEDEVTTERSGGFGSTGA